MGSDSKKAEKIEGPGRKFTPTCHYPIWKKEPNCSHLKATSVYLGKYSVKCR